MIYLKFIVGVLILLFSTQRFVKLAENISIKLKISPLIIGLTIVAIGTSLPEMTVSLISVLKNDSGLAIGNIIGSNIINLLFVFPVGILIGKLRIGTTKTQKNAVLLLGITLLYFSSRFISPLLRPLFGVLLIGLSSFISYFEYRMAIIGRTNEDKKQINKKLESKVKSISLLAFIAFLIGIIAGGILIVESVESISRLTGISTTILGLTLTAVATSLPELFTTIFSQKDDQEKLTVGNIIGSNIYNLLLIGGFIFLFPISFSVANKDWIWLIVTTGIFTYVIKHYSGKTPPKKVAFLLLIFFLLFVLTQ